MKRFFALAMILTLLLCMTGWAGAEEEFNPLRSKYREYLALLDANAGNLGRESGFSVVKSIAVNGEGNRVVLDFGLLPAQDTIMRPWFMRIKAGTEQAADLQLLYMQALYLSQQLQQANLSLWDFSSVTIDPSSTGEMEMSMSLFNELKWAADPFGFFAFKMADAFANDEMYIMGCFQQEPAVDTETATQLELAENAPIYEVVFVAIPEQDFVFDVVNSLYHAENTRHMAGKELIEWLSRRPESGFLAPVVIVEEEPEAFVRIQEKSDVNVRQKPNTDSKRVGRAKAGQEYKWLSTASNGWYEIQLDEDTTGYVSHKVTSLIEK